MWCEIKKGGSSESLPFFIKKAPPVTARLPDPGRLHIHHGQQHRGQNQNWFCPGQCRDGGEQAEQAIGSRSERLQPLQHLPHFHFRTLGQKCAGLAQQEQRQKNPHVAHRFVILMVITMWKWRSPVCVVPNHASELPSTSGFRMQRNGDKADFTLITG